MPFRKGLGPFDLKKNKVGLFGMPNFIGWSKNEEKFQKFQKF
jgi:hypothetical protein